MKVEVYKVKEEIGSPIKYYDDNLYYISNIDNLNDNKKAMIINVEKVRKWGESNTHNRRSSGGYMFEHFEEHFEPYGSMFLLSHTVEKYK